MDSSLEALGRKGNLAAAPDLYNPGGVAAHVVHFTPWPPDVQFESLFAPARIEIYPFLDNPGPGPRMFRAVVGFGRIVRKMRRERINLIRGRLPYFGSLLGCVGGRLLGIPSIVSLGGNNRLAQDLTGDYPFGRRWLANAVEWLVLRVANRILVPNRYTLAYVGQLIGGRRAVAKTEVLPWRLESSCGSGASAADELGVGRESPMVLVVGFLNRYKHTDIMFDVARELLRSRTSVVEFVFCGDGPLRAEGEELFRGDRRARFLGWQPQAVVQQLIQAAAVVLVPMSGFVLLEAAAAGRPVVAADIEWHGEIVEDRVSGRLVGSRDVHAWVDAIRELLADAPLAARVGAALHERFERDYSPDVLRRREASLYLETAGLAVRTPIDERA